MAWQGESRAADTQSVITAAIEKSKKSFETGERRLKVRKVLNSPLIEAEKRSTKVTTKLVNQSTIKVPPASKLADELFQRLIPVFEENKTLDVHTAIRLPSKLTRSFKETTKYTALISASLGAVQKIYSTVLCKTGAEMSGKSSVVHQHRTAKCVYPVPVLSDQVVLCDNALIKAMCNHFGIENAFSLSLATTNETKLFMINDTENASCDMIDRDSPTSAVEKMSLPVDQRTPQIVASKFLGTSPMMTPVIETAMPSGGSRDLSKSANSDDPSTAQDTDPASGVQSASSGAEQFEKEKPISDDKKCEDPNTEILKRSNLSRHDYVIRNKSKLILPKHYASSSSSSSSNTSRSMSDPFLKSKRESRKGESSKEKQPTPLETDAFKSEDSLSIEEKNVLPKGMEETLEKDAKDQSLSQSKSLDDICENQADDADQNSEHFRTLLSNLNTNPNSNVTRSDICSCCGFKTEDHAKKIDARRKQRRR